MNPSAEETYGMNVAEAAACGTRSIVVEGSACVEAADNPLTVSIDLSDLASIVVDLAGDARDSHVHDE